MQGNGGTVSSSIVAEHAVATVMSGPASGVIAAAVTAMQAGARRAIRERRHLRHGRHVERRRAGARTACRRSRAISSSSTRCRSTCRWSTSTRSAPAAARSPRSTRGGMLRVGPESAGATPGPICYGRGGTRPTITDANLVLGRLDPERLLGGRPSGLDRRDLRAAILSTVGTPLGLDATAAAAAIVRVANDKMAGAMRMVSLARGHDPRDFALFAFGGAGPLHAVALAARARHPEGADPGAPGADQCARLRRRRPAPRLRRDRQPAARGARRRAHRRGLPRADRRRPRTHRARAGRGRAHRQRAPRRHAVPGPEPHPAGRGDSTSASP